MGSQNIVMRLYLCIQLVNGSCPSLYTCHYLKQRKSTKAEGEREREKEVRGNSTMNLRKVWGSVWSRSNARIRRRRFRFFVFFCRRVRSATDGYTSPDTDADGAKRLGEIEMCG